MTIALSDMAITRLTEAAAQRGMDTEELLLALLDQHEATEADMLLAALADAEAGRMRPAAVVHAELRTRYNLPDLASLTPEEVAAREDAALVVLTPSPYKGPGR
jgi:predicted short-subunit dehydrogenase-like oxidoreductase (DUF2520 family)